MIGLVLIAYTINGLSEVLDHLVTVDALTWFHESKPGWRKAAGHFRNGRPRLKNSPESVYRDSRHSFESPFVSLTPEYLREVVARRAVRF
jgi:hypothetical protein